jgi:hypothetical protein
MYSEFSLHDRLASACEEAGAFLESFLSNRANGAEHIPLALDVRVMLTPISSLKSAIEST